MLYYETHKTAAWKPWVVFIHGAGGNVKTWSYQVPHFTDFFNLLLIDLRDHGQSKNIRPQAEDYNFSLITEDIKQVLDREGIMKAHFVTLSFGSVLLQDFYMRYPDFVKRIVIAGGIFKGNFFIRSFVQFARLLNIFLSFPDMYRLFSYMLMPRKHHQLSRRLYQRQAARLTHTEYMKWIKLYAEFFRLLRRFYHQTLQVKTLVVMGEQDYVFLRAARAFISRQSNATLKVVPSAGHIVNIDASGTFNTMAVDFLKEMDEEDKTP